MNTKVGLERLSSSSSDLRYFRFGIHIHRGPPLRPDRRGRHYYILTVSHLIPHFYRPDRYGRYGEVVDINLPRDKETGKTKGFGFLMYEDQRSTILAVDNLNGANVLDRTLRVDHVKKYKQARVKDEEGEWKEREEQSLNAKPEMIGECPILPHFLARLYTFSRRWRLGIVRINRS